MVSGFYVIALLALSLVTTGSIRLGSWGEDKSYCESLKFTFDTNNAASVDQIPVRCEKFVKEYMTGKRYRSDSEATADSALEFAKTVKLAGDGKDAWVFDVDETLLSNLPYFAKHGYGTEPWNETSFYEWVDLAKAPALPASLRLYKEVEQLGFTIFVLTARHEYMRNVTNKNLLLAGYSNYKRLILRQPSDSHKPDIQFKSERRKELEEEGYILHGSCGDLWTDLNGFAVAERSFKLPNMLYYYHG